MSAKKRSAFPRSTALLLTLVAVLLTTFVGLSVYYSTTGSSGSLRTLLHSETAAVIDETTEPVTEPPKPVAMADGNASGVLYQASYTVPASSAAQQADKVVATAGSEQLTNRQLQIYYLAAVEAGRSAEVAPQPDIPLDCQLCPLGDGNLSWQHYYLQQALAIWRTQLGLVAGTKEPQIIHEEAFKPDKSLHEKYIAADLPVNGFLYQDLPNYQPNSMHQAYLDNMETRLNTLAVSLGYADLQDMMRQVYGAGTTTQDLSDAARAFNLAYMYYTEKTYDLDYTDESLTVPDSETYTVSLRQVLLIPEGGKVGKDGKVTATKEQWEACYKLAETTLTSWRREYMTTRNLPANFARLANRMSQDAGSKINGGFYYNLHQGELIAPLDEWCFASDRKVGDIAILRSDVGIHIVYLHSILDGDTTQAHTALLRQQEQEILEKYSKKITVKPDYSAVSLWVDTNRESVTLIDALYPDVSHERFPEAMTYLQQDYMHHPYGGSYVGRGGCGITTMAMLSTYMTDTIHSPAELATTYGMYHDASGTNGDIFRYVPEELGFYLEKTSNNINEVIDALQNGQVVISLQVLGHFTSGGHYLLLQKYYPEDDTFQVRDSNVYNYGKLSGHQEDRFNRWQVLSGGATFWIMQKKITAIPCCDRCGLNSPERGPELLLSEDYLCEKCTVAQARRENFLAAIL